MFVKYCTCLGTYKHIHALIPSKTNNLSARSPVSDVEYSRSLHHKNLEVPLKTRLPHRVNGPVPVVVIIRTKVLEKCSK